MAKFSGSGNSVTALNVGLLVLRVGIAGMLMHHGYGKLVGFSEMEAKFMSFMGLSPAVTLGLVIFAEFFCSILLVIGWFTRIASIPIIIAMFVAVWKAHDGDIFGKGEMATLYLIAAICILLVGAGKYSVDGMVRGK